MALLEHMCMHCIAAVLADRAKGLQHINSLIDLHSSGVEPLKLLDKHST